jgi:hypothetical protein
MKTVWVLVSAELMVSVADAIEVLEYRFADQLLMHATDTSGNDIHGQLRSSDTHYALSQPRRGYANALNGVDEFINAGDRRRWT